MKRMGVSFAVAAALSMALPPTAAAANKEQQQLMAELRMLQQHQQQLQQLIVSLTDTLKAVTTKMDDQATTARKALADQRLLIEGITEGVRVLREKADDTNVRLSSVTQELEAMRQTIASLPAPAAAAPPATGEPGAEPAAPPGPGGPTTAPPVVTAPPPGVSPQRTYDAAFSDYAGGQWDVAIMGFETFLKMFPRDPRAHEAQLNIGNALYAAGKYSEAVAAYQRVISDYPKTGSVPQAYYKLGLSYQQLKEIALARKAYETVLQNFPNDVSYTSLARQALDRLPKQP